MVGDAPGERPDLSDGRCPPTISVMAGRAWKKLRGWPRWAKVATWVVVGLVAVGAAVGEDDRSVDAAGSVTSTSSSSRAEESTSTSSLAPTATTTATPTTTTPPREPASALLLTIPVADEYAGIPYDRESFDEGQDLDGDGCRTRCEVLAQQRRPSLDGFPDGGWVSIYDGYASDEPRDFEVDHVVALSEAWRSGAWAWDAETRRAFANDEDGLILATTASNQAKADRDPSSWRPAERSAWCRFAMTWTTMKARYQLTAQPSEVAALAEILEGCTVASAAVAPASVVTTTTTTTAPPPPRPAPIVPLVPLVPQTTPPPPPPVASPPGNCHPSYPTVCIPPGPPDLDCPDIPHRRFTVVGADPHRFDGDHDGVGCET